MLLSIDFTLLIFTFVSCDLRDVFPDAFVHAAAGFATFPSTLELELCLSL
jgi:hypothetical protein